MTTATTPIRWLHLSDFHVGKDDYATRKMFDYILAHVRKRKQAGFIPDLLFITGDLTNKGLSTEYEALWQDFIWPLQEEIGGDIVQRTFVVPGNHDVDRIKLSAFSREEIANPESHYLDPTDEGARHRGDMLIPRIQAYLDNDCTRAKGAFSTPEGAYAHCLTIHDQNVGIAGINTAWLCKDDKDERQLTPGKPLLEKALNTISPAKLRIVLGHHPIDWFIPVQQKSIKRKRGLRKRGRYPYLASPFLLLFRFLVPFSTLIIAAHPLDCRVGLRWRLIQACVVGTKRVSSPACSVFAKCLERWHQPCVRTGSRIAFSVDASL